MKHFKLVLFSREENLDLVKGCAFMIGDHCPTNDSNHNCTFVDICSVTDTTGCQLIATDICASDYGRCGLEDTCGTDRSDCFTRDACSLDNNGNCNFNDICNQDNGGCTGPYDICGRDNSNCTYADFCASSDYSSCTGYDIPNQECIYGH